MWSSRTPEQIFWKLGWYEDNKPILYPLFNLRLFCFFLFSFVFTFLRHFADGVEVAVRSCTISPLQVSIHVVQDRHIGTQTSHWVKTNNGNYDLNLSLLLVLPQCDFCVPICRSCTTWMETCKGLIVQERTATSTPSAKCRRKVKTKENKKKQNNRRLNKG